MIRRCQQPEKAEQSAIVQLLRSLGAAVYVLGTRRRKGDYQGTMQTPGIPDLLIFLPLPSDVAARSEHDWRQVWVEVKAPTGRPSYEQRDFAQRCVLAGQDHITGGIDAVTGYLIVGGWLIGPRQRKVS